MVKVKLVRLREGQKIMEREDEIILPRAYYVVSPTTELQKVFIGKTVPMPYSLMLYLCPNESKLFFLIFDQIRQNGHCLLSAKEMAKYLAMSASMISRTIARMKKMGLVYQRKVGQYKDTLIDYKTIQKIEELTANLTPDAPTVLRGILKNFPPIEISTNDREKLERRCEVHVFDPIEDEEYN